MVSEDVKQGFGASSFVGNSSRPRSDARSAAPQPPPEAEIAVNQLADSFRQMLMRAVETDPSQLQALSSLVASMGLQAKDGASQQEIDKMAKSLSSLSVGKARGVQLLSNRVPCVAVRIGVSLFSDVTCRDSTPNCLTEVSSTARYTAEQWQ
jgi:hypothetical protein